MIDAELSGAYDSAGELLDAYGRAGDDERHATVLALRPSVDELRGYFCDDVIDDVIASYHVMWDDDPVWVAEAGAEAIMYCARAREFRRGSMMTRHFPGGYRAIARYLQPRAIWVAWHFVAPGFVGRALPSAGFDGLVRVGDGAWRWCPRPARLLATRSAREARARQPVSVSAATAAQQERDRSRERVTLSLRAPVTSDGK